MKMGRAKQTHGRFAPGYDTLVLLSGGLDSTVLAYQLASQGKRVRALYFDMDREASRFELAAARRAAFRLRMPLEILELASLDRLVLGHIPPKELLSGSAGEKLNLGTTQTLVMPQVPVLLSIGNYFAHATEVAEVAIGLTADDFVGLPDRSGVLDKFASALACFFPDRPPVRFLSPLIDTAKADVVALGRKLDVELAETWSCVGSRFVHCGRCAACKRRSLAFRVAGGGDPTEYQNRETPSPLAASAGA